MSELSQFWWTAAAFNEHDGYSVRRFGLFSAEQFLWLGIAVIVIALCVVLYRRLKPYRAQKDAYSRNCAAYLRRAPQVCRYGCDRAV